MLALDTSSLLTFKVFEPRIVDAQELLSGGCVILY